MIGSPFEVHYDWQAQRPIRPLVLTVSFTQLGAAVVGCFVLTAIPSLFERAWIAACAATLPGYLAGCAVQYRVGRQRWSEHRPMIRNLGLIALVLSALALCVYRSKTL